MARKATPQCGWSSDASRLGRPTLRREPCRSSTRRHLVPAPTASSPSRRTSTSRLRLVPMEGDRFNLSAEEAVKRCDENTIGVVAILGSTFDGRTSPCRRSATRSTPSSRRRGIDVPVHVDGASGAMIAPFLDPDLEWDFRLPRVASINTSGSQVRPRLPGRRLDRLARRRRAAGRPDLLGQLPRRQHADVRAELLRPGAQVVAQYYNFLRLGYDGYRHGAGIRAGRRDRLSRSPRSAPFELVTRGDELPVFAFTLTGRSENYTVFDAHCPRERGWQVPAYLPGDTGATSRALSLSSYRGRAPSATIWPTTAHR